MERHDRDSRSRAEARAAAEIERRQEASVLWTAIVTERRALIDRTTPGAGRCGWPRDEGRNA